MGTTNSKPHGPIRNIEPQSGPIYYTLFLEVHNYVAPFTSHGKLHEFGAEKPIFWAKPAHFDFFTIHFNVESLTEHRWRCS
jgi:hypothetical protein